jgi:hypothetical protein
MRKRPLLSPGPSIRAGVYFIFIFYDWMMKTSYIGVCQMSKYEKFFTKTGYMEEFIECKKEDMVRFIRNTIKN